MESLKNWLDSLRFDFVSRRWYFFAFSTLCVVLSWAAFFIIGPNWGIDFTGGTEVRIQFEEPVTTDELREAIETIGIGGDAVQQIGSAAENQFAIRVQDPEFGMRELADQVRSSLEQKFGAGWITDMQMNAEVGARFTITHSGDPVQTDDVKAALGSMDGVGVQPGRDESQFIVIAPGLSQQVQKEIGASLGDREFKVLSVDAVGPKVGDDLKRSSFIAMFATLGLILLYTAFRFDFAYGPGAILALLHDISLPIGIFTVMGLQFDLGLIGALLTILGYSINDTIVIYDRIRENRDKHRRTALTTVVNDSINETLTRTISTSFTMLTSITLFLFMGGPVLFSFAFAMFLGGIFGVYSTIFIASPMVILFEDLKPTFQRWAMPAAAVSDMGGPPIGSAPATPPIGRGAIQPQITAAAPPPPVRTGDAPAAPERPLTESEKRRRERADAERKHSG